MVYGRDVVLPVQAFIGLPPQDSSNTDLESADNYVKELREQLEKIHSLLGSA
ncbi:hypothetical protein DPMN_115917 [Dreissena polymorpha]|uniref:Uncharacterized protein n=1 Tax=Dreissena polymorpha TaxID=45954 RepID=A0A9D4KML7_DREPO|nr:hypothetical protein DPMN_115917 [Dreissena polymorpha]